MSIFFNQELAKSYFKKRFPLASEAEIHKIINDWDKKIRVSRKVVVDFKSRITDPNNLIILDSGCGNGGLSISFAEAGANVFGVDIEKELIDIAKAHANAYGVKPTFCSYDGFKLPFGDNSFDAVLSTSVLEHVSDPVNYLREILRVLKVSGYLYLALPNRLWPKETHTLLWFITYVPYKIAKIIVRFFKKNPLEENNLHFYTYWNVVDMIKKTGKVGNGKFMIIEEKGSSSNVIKKIIKNSLKIFGVSYKAFLPHIQLIIKKCD